MDKILIKYNNELLKNKIRLEKSLLSTKKEIALEQNRCEHIPALLLHDEMYCIICRRKLENAPNYINTCGGPISANISYEKSINTKIEELQVLVSELLDANSKITNIEIIEKVNQKIKK